MAGLCIVLLPFRRTKQRPKDQGCEGTSQYQKSSLSFEAANHENQEIIFGVNI